MAFTVVPLFVAPGRGRGIPLVAVEERGRKRRKEERKRKEEENGEKEGRKEGRKDEAVVNVAKVGAVVDVVMVMTRVVVVEVGVMRQWRW